MTQSHTLIKPNSIVIIVANFYNKIADELIKNALIEFEYYYRLDKLRELELNEDEKVEAPSMARSLAKKHIEAIFQSREANAKFEKNSQTSTLRKKKVEIISLPNGKDDIDIAIIKIPGVFEIPSMVSNICKNHKDIAGIVTLGAVIKGETPHFDYICQQSTFGLTKLSMKYEIPMGMGIITALNEEQAKHRSSGDGKNVGGFAMSACLELIDIFRELKS